MVRYVSDAKEPPSPRRPAGPGPVAGPTPPPPLAAVLIDFHGTLAQVEDPVDWVLAAADDCGETLSQAIDAASPDLSAFRSRGGKLIHYHGWADPGVPPGSSVAYYERVAAQSGLGEGSTFTALAPLARLQEK